MKQKLLKVLELVLAGVLVVSLVMIFRTQAAYTQGASTYAEAAVMAEVPQLTAVPLPEKRETAVEQEEAGEEETVAADPNLVLLAEVNLDELREQNPDVLGWISIPGTVLSYPVLRGEDNDFYLKHTWQKNSSVVGSIFMDYRSNTELTDFNTVIYGHRMRDGSMFASLKDYRDQEHWRTHPSIYLACDGGVYRYEIFSAYEADTLGAVYDFNVRDEEGRKAFIDLSLKLSVIETESVPTADDRILTLSTCTGRGYRTRWVVQAVLAESYDGGEEMSGGELPPAWQQG